MVKKKVPQKVFKAINSYIERLRNDGLQINAAYLYGSYAKGTYNKWSDIDLCVVSDGLKGEFLLDLAYLNSLSRDGIEAIGYLTEDFEEEAIPIIYEVKKYGVKVV